MHLYVCLYILFYFISAFELPRRRGNLGDYSRFFQGPLLLDLIYLIIIAVQIGPEARDGHSVLGLEDIKDRLLIGGVSDIADSLRRLAFLGVLRLLLALVFILVFPG